MSGAGLKMREKLDKRFVFMLAVIIIESITLIVCGIVLLCML